MWHRDRGVERLKYHKSQGLEDAKAGRYGGRVEKERPGLSLVRLVKRREKSDMSTLQGQTLRIK
jgi:hypothetical protein